MKKAILFIATGLMCFTAICQVPNPDLIKEWYLHNITISSTTYYPTDYNFYPTIGFINDGQNYSFFLPDPVNVYCSTDVIQFSQDPDSFQLAQGWLCLPDQPCFDGPQGPCSIIYGLNADFYYYTLASPFNYTLTYNSDGTLTLQVVNVNGDIAVYGNELPLLVPNFSKNQYRILPNPVSETLFIISEKTLINKIAVYSITGEKVLEKTNIENAIDVSSLQQGIYFLEIISETGRSIQKFIKE